MMYRIDGIAISICALLIPVLVFASSLARSGERNIGTLETIHGIPYPSDSGSIVILEEMAHADLYLAEPVFAKQAKFLISFDPALSTSIDIGVREDEFWLSYKKYPLYRKGIGMLGFQTKEIVIPLTTALQDTDRSIDIMLFTDSTNNLPEWRIHTFRARLEFTMPVFSDVKSYVKTILTRERAL